ncbi:MAG: GPP34 family phosphoprotein [Prolixibacteraceae bacterium]|nr:GPP34 family phosphoprotein [Prolixibacteraceae bacterium]
MTQDLKLSEKLFCLSVNPKNGGILMNASAALSMTIAGSVFVELIKKELVSIENGVVHLEKPTLQNDEIHEFFLKPIRLREKDRKIRTWISWFNARGRKIRKLFLRDLVRKNVLRIEEKRFLFIPYDKIYLRDRELVENIRKEVETTLLGKSSPTDDSIILAVMAGKTNLLQRVFPERAQRKEAARNLKKLPETQVSKAVQEAIQMMHAAVVAAAT